MHFPTVDNVSEVIQNIQKLKKAKQDYRKACATSQKFERLNEQWRQRLWKSYVQPTLNIVLDRFKEFNLYGCIQLYGSGKWKSKEAINIMLDNEGISSSDSDNIAIDEIIKELEKVSQSLTRDTSNDGAGYIKNERRTKIGNKMGDKIQDDIITLTVAVKEFSVSKTTLRRAVKDGRLKNCQQKTKPKNSLIMVSKAEVAKYWTKK